ncbi:MAG: hypothetical protein JRH20_15155 [Deltaproteobacteria bacterium]|nr:hypothetical protein [Deltaproteobacteria bacterium]
MSFMLRKLVRLQGPHGDVTFDLQPRIADGWGTFVLTTSPLEHSRHWLTIARSYIHPADQFEVPVVFDQDDADFLVADPYERSFFPQSVPRLLAVKNLCYASDPRHHSASSPSGMGALSARQQTAYDSMILYFSEQVSRASILGRVSLLIASTQTTLETYTDSDSYSFGFSLPLGFDLNQPVQLQLAPSIQGVDGGHTLDANYDGLSDDQPFTLQITLGNHCSYENAWHPPQV